MPLIKKTGTTNIGKFTTTPISKSTLPTAASIAAAGLLFNNQKHYKTNLGFSYDAMTQNLNFKVASKNATHINLYLFDKPVDGKVIKTIEMKKKGNVWSANLNKEEQEKLKMCREIIL